MSPPSTPPPSAPLPSTPGGRRSGQTQLSLGLAAVGRPAYITLGREADLPAGRSPAALEKRTHELLDAAVAVGIRYVDAARSYGSAEQFLASWLRGAGAEPFVASKWGYRYTAGWRTDVDQHEVKDHSRATFEHQWAETSELLGPWLRLYQVHSLTLDSPLWTDRALLRTLAGVRARGAELGFSTSGPAQADTVRRGLELTVDGQPLFTSVQATWNLLQRSAGEALAGAHEAGARVVVKEALANGRLARAGSAATAELGRAARARGRRCRRPRSRRGHEAALGPRRPDRSGHRGPAGVERHGHRGGGRPRPAGPRPPQPAADYWAERSRLP